MKKRVLSMILSICMLCSLLPTTAFAASCDGADCNHVAAIGNEHFESVQDAVNEAQGDDTVTLLRNIDLGTGTLTVTGAGQKTINFNGYTITSDCSGTQMLSVTGGSELTLLDDSEEKIGGLYATNDDRALANLIRVETGGKLIIEGGNYHQAASNSNGSGMIDSRSKTGVAIYIKGGNFQLDNLAEFDNDHPWIFNVSGQGYTGIQVTGGTFNANIQRQKWATEVLVPDAHYVERNSNGTWTVKEGSVLSVKEGTLSGPNYKSEWSIGYPSFAAFIAAANADSPSTIDPYDPITLLADIDEDVRIDLKKNEPEKDSEFTMNLNLNGKKATGTFTLCNENIVLNVAEGEGLDVVSVVDGYREVYENDCWSLKFGAHHTVIFDSMGGTAVEPQRFEGDGGKVTEPPEDLEKSGYTFGGWYEDEACTVAYDFDRIVEDTFTLYAKWLPNFKVTFNTDGGDAVVAATVAEGTLLERPTDPAKSGYTFAGWYSDAGLTTAYNFNTAVAGDITLYAKWTPAQLTGTVTITGTVQVGETLTATVSGSNNTGTLSYKWYRQAEDSVLMGESTNYVYVITEDAIAQKIYCVVSSDVQTGTLESEETAIVPNLIFPVGAISAEGYTGTYDGQPHGITVTAPEGTTVYYGTDGENYNLNASPTYTNAGTYTIYYRVVKDNYDGATGSAVVNIGKADPTVTAWPTVEGTVYVNDNTVTLKDDGTVTGVDDTALDGSFAVGPTDLTSAGQKTVTVTFAPADSTNYNMVEKTDYQVTVSNRPVYSDDLEPSYSVTIPDCENGTIQLNRRYAERGQTVTVTVIPDEGYVLETLLVTDRYGKELGLTAKDDGKYTFKMPGGKVTVTATFMEDNTMLNYFTDVFASDYYYDAVLWAAKKGITGGTSATTFSPSNPCTRAQMAAFLWRAAGSPEPADGTIPFMDVSADAYYAKAVQWAYEQGITGGTSATTFSPDDTCTRGQMATFLWRSAASSVITETESPFMDVPENAYYATAVEWAYKQGITGGTSATTFSPDAPCTRAQMVTFLYRHLG